MEKQKYLHEKLFDLFRKKNKNDEVKIIFNMPKEDFKDMLEKDIIPFKRFSVLLSKKEVLKLMEDEDEVELNYGEYDYKQYMGI